MKVKTLNGYLKMVAKMIKHVKHLHTIYNNPFLFTPLIVNFYNNYKGQDKDILLSYLVLPLVLHEDTRNWLQNARSNSSLSTFGRNRENYYGLPERVKEYKQTTNQCLQYSIDNNIIKINENIQLEVITKDIGYNDFLKDSFKASGNIGKIFKDIDVVSIYRALGVKKI